ncbi:MAG: S-layer homology domain-containing protein [Clostridia bacterium]|nr:S-layer homology domain-containing protein [Clostridia bacterium]
MKRFLTAVLVLLLLTGAMPLSAFGAEKTDFATRIHVVSGETWHTEEDGSGEEYETLLVEYQLKGSGIKGIQGAWFAVDMSHLLLVDFAADGYSVRDEIADGQLVPGKLPTRLSRAGLCALKETVTSGRKTVDSWTYSTINGTLAAVSEDEKTLFLCPQPMQSHSVTYADYTTVVSFRFAVLPGASLTENAVWFVTETERDHLRQSFIAAMNDGKSGYFYGNTSAADTLASPTVAWDAPTSEEVPTPPPVTDVPSTTEPAAKHPFTDIPANAAYQEAVVYVYEKGLFQGTSSTTFAPNTSMTRAMFVTVLGRLAGVDPSQYPGKTFDDVVENTWYSPYVRWASEEGIVQGYGNGLFGVEDTLTIEQAVVIMARYAEHTGRYITVSAWEEGYHDCESVSAWAVSPMKWAVKNGIYTGEKGWLTPQSPAKRSLLAEILYAYSNKIT